MLNLLVLNLQSKGPWYGVETGRRDGNVTVAEYAENDLAPPDSNIVDVKTFFSVKSLTAKDIVVLFGTHLSSPSLHAYVRPWTTATAQHTPH